MTTRPHITLVELQRRIKMTLSEQFALPVWVSAEVADLKVNYSGHCYLELIEKDHKSENGVPTAQVRAVIWRSSYSRIAAYFEAETGQRLAPGIRILAQVLISYHELYGLSLQITDIDSAYTLGEMEQQRQKTIARLQEEGVWEMNRAVPMPLLVQRLAVVSSAQAAGYQDFCKELSRSGYRFDLTLFDAVMQGTAAEESILMALGRVAERQEEFDAVVIVRGGGSTTDLNCFNAYRLSSHVAQFPLPVLTGIGHDKDQSVVDMVAHLPLKTPTAVAGWLIERMSSIEGWLEGAAQQLHDITTTRMREAQLQLEQQSNRLRTLASERTLRERLNLEQAEQLLSERVKNLLRFEQQRIKQAEAVVESHSPQQILKLGFAILRAENRAIRTTEELQKQHRLEVELADGKSEIILKQ
ncbi:MAG: exodeoxyribonuclease VII large subunit [Alistipes sp.]|nr:exodeoxyribonuclease VII large subunit [Alistipes sp.]